MTGGSRPVAGTQLIDGEVGDIELFVDLPPDSSTAKPAAMKPAAIAVCCHPHPLFGGALTNKVIHTVARNLAASGALTVRFNFRGVGASSGTHDQGQGELRDLLRVAEWARAHQPEAPLWLAGFSFGAWMVLRAQSRLAPAALITVAPPVGRWDFSEVKAPLCPWLLLQGTSDELVDAQSALHWARTLQPRVQVKLLDGADHFFHARLHEVADAVRDFIATEATHPRRV